jgi:rod shape-determining protein MreC
MESFPSRYRNLSVLLLLLVAQLLLLAYQVKTSQDVRLIRLWAVTAVTPVARAIEWVRSGVAGAWENVFVLGDVRAENKQLKRELAELRLKNQLLAAELQTADRTKALIEFRSQVPSKTIAARIIGTGTGANARTVFVDRGSVEGVKRGMAAITDKGIVGKVVAAYPTASLVQLITEQGSAAGVISQKNRVRGTLKAQGSGTLIVDYIRNEEKVEIGEWFYTSGTDRIYPRGLPVGRVKSTREGRGSKEVIIEPSGLQGGLEEMLIVLDGVHGSVPEPETPPSPGIAILPAPPEAAPAAQPAQPVGAQQAGGTQQSAAPPASTSPSPSQPAQASSNGLATDADRLRERYRRVGESQGIVLGTTKLRVPDFNKAPADPPKPAPPKPEAPPPASPKPGAADQTPPAVPKQ